MIALLDLGGEGIASGGVGKNLLMMMGGRRRVRSSIGGVEGVWKLEQCDLPEKTREERRRGLEHHLEQSVTHTPGCKREGKMWDRIAVAGFGGGGADENPVEVWESWSVPSLHLRGTVSLSLSLSVSLSFQVLTLSLFSLDFVFAQ